MLSLNKEIMKNLKKCKKCYFFINQSSFPFGEVISLIFSINPIYNISTITYFIQFTPDIQFSLRFCTFLLLMDESIPSNIAFGNAICLRVIKEG